MKIVHVATMDTGGAANAATRIHLGLLEENVDSKFLFLHQSRVVPNSFLASKRSFSAGSSMISKITRKILGLKFKEQKNNEVIADLKGNYEVFTFPYSDYRIENEELIKGADIIHLHWIGNFVNFPTFFRKINKPIVWTFHDFNPLLGGFHYPGDATRNEKIFGHLEKQLKKEKQIAITSIKNLTITTYSKWLIEFVLQEEAFKNRNISYILSGLDLKKFKPIDQKAARDYFEIPQNKTVFLFVSDSISNFRKGLDILQSALDEIQKSQDVHLVVVGGKSDDGNEKQNHNILYVDRVQDDRVLSLLYSAADFFIMPSREEVLGLVALEAMACGTPAIAFSAGGLRDVIIDGYNGVLVNDISVKGLINALRKVIDGEYKFNRTAIREFAISNFDKRIQIGKYKRLYEEILT